MPPKSGFDLAIVDCATTADIGIALCKKLCKTMPVIMIDGSDDEICTTAALNSGADDYIARPVRQWELLARIKNVLRRSKTTETLHHRNLSVDPVRGVVYKNNEEIFPISPEKTKKVLLVNAKGFDGGFGKFIALMQGPQKGPVDIIKELLDQEGFQVEIYESPIDKIMKLPKEEMGAALGNVYAGKRPISELTSKYDLIINVADVGASVDQRLQWPPSKGTPDIPFYVNEIPTIFVSVQCPFHLADVPQVKTYINTYDSKDYTLKALVDKMMGRSEFKGVSPVDAFCGLGDTRY